MFEKDSFFRSKAFIICVIIESLLIGSAIQYFITTDEVIVEGEVVDVDFNDDFMVVTFDDGNTYNINYRRGMNRDIDLTVNSVMRIKLTKGSFWLFPNTDNVWTIDNIVRIPDVR